jgi:tRNA threonylcarbamoyladenosine biosynthesis protein TsaB
MALILCIETSGDLCSACLCQDGNVVIEREQYGKNHASQLIPIIAELFKATTISNQSLDAVAVSAGPGSFTGLRIGVASAKAICYAARKPLIALSSLQILAAGVNKKINAPGYIICATVDAGRNEIYFGLYNSVNECVKADEATEAGISFFEILKHHKKVIIAGSGALKCKNLSPQNSHFLYEEKLNVKASFMNELAQRFWQEEKFRELASLEPFYLKGAYIRS